MARVFSPVVGVICLPAVALIPLAGIDPGAHASFKLAILAAAVIVFAAGVRASCRMSALEGMLGAFVVLATIATVLAGDSPATSVPVLGGLALLAICAWCARRSLVDRWSAIEVAVLAAAASVAGFALLELLGVSLPWAPVRRPASTLGNRNHVAQYLAMTLPIMIGAALRGRRVAIPVIVLAVAVVVVARCRSAYLALACGLAIIPVAACWLGTPRTSRGRRTAVIAALAAGVAAGFVPWPGVAFRGAIVDSTRRVFAHDSGTGLGRVRQHELAVAALRDRPALALIGAGAGAWERVASAYAHEGDGHTPRFTGAAVPNSELVRVAVEQGIVGLCTLVLALLLAVRNLVRRGDPERARQRATILAALTAAAVCGVFDPLLVRPECVALLGVLVGVTSTTAHPRAPSRTGVRLTIGAILVAVALASTFRTASFVVGSPRSLAGLAPGSAAWEARLAVAHSLAPRPTLDERLALGLAAHDRCGDAEAALARFVSARRHHWGARVAVARCFGKVGQTEAARRVWIGAFTVEPHLRALLETARMSASVSR